MKSLEKKSLELIDAKDMPKCPQNGNGERLDVRVNLFGKTRSRFLTIKATIGLENGTEAVRFIINDYYETEFMKKQRRAKEHEG